MTFVCSACQRVSSLGWSVPTKKITRISGSFQIFKNYGFLRELYGSKLTHNHEMDLHGPLNRGPNGPMDLQYVTRRANFIFLAERVQPILTANWSISAYHCASDLTIIEWKRVIFTLKYYVRERNTLVAV